MSYCNQITPLSLWLFPDTSNDTPTSHLFHWPLLIPTCGYPSFLFFLYSFSRIESFPFLQFISLFPVNDIYEFMHCIPPVLVLQGDPVAWILKYGCFSCHWCLPQQTVTCFQPVVFLKMWIKSSSNSVNLQSLLLWLVLSTEIKGIVSLAAGNKH